MASMSSAWRFGDKMIGQKFATKTRLPVFRNARTQLGESTNSFHFVLVFLFLSIIVISTGIMTKVGGCLAC